MNKKTLFRYENFLITIMFLTYGLVWMDRYSIIYLFPFIERKMNLTNTDLGLAMSVLAITWGLSSVVLYSLIYQTNLVLKNYFLSYLSNYFH